MAEKIFELGLKKFKMNTAFLHEYAKFIQMLNESNNTRVLYERVLSDQKKDEKNWKTFIKNLTRNSLR